MIIYLLFSNYRRIQTFVYVSKDTVSGFPWALEYFPEHTPGFVPYKREDYKI